MNNRTRVLGLALIVLSALVLLAAGLDEMRLGPGRPLDLGPDSAPGVVLPSLDILDEDTPVWRILLFWLAFVANLVLFFLFLPPALRRRIIRQLVSLALGVLALLLALRYQVLEWPEALTEPAEDGQGGIAVPGAPADLQPLQPPQVAPWIAYVVSLIVLWVILLVLYFAYRYWNHHHSQRSAALRRIAGPPDALADLATGHQWADVVMQAYTRMNEAVRVTRGLQRESSSTPREFAARLVHTGLPISSVDELTRLFESVRYGGRASDDAAALRAAACLESIPTRRGAA
jgi:hypothetical protein